MVELREAFGDKVDRRGVFCGDSRSCGTRKCLHLERIVMNKARSQWFRYILRDDTDVNGEGVKYNTEVSKVSRCNKLALNIFRLRRSPSSPSLPLNDSPATLAGDNTTLKLETSLS